MPYNIRVVVKAKRISIIIPAYNEERYLGRCLESIALQTKRPYEVIVVDNDSSDTTAAVARQFPFVTLLKQPRRGRIFAQTIGFQYASGDILTRIDADAVLPPGWVQRVASYFERPGTSETAWTCGADFYNVRLPRLVSWAYGYLAFQINHWLTGHPSLWGSSMALPRQQWQEVADEVCMRPDLHEDLDLSIHLHRHGCRIVYDAQMKVGAELRPAYASTRKLWAYLELWPRTLRIHGIATWPLCWILNVGMFISMPFFGISERIARLFGRKPFPG
jgi:glycosyltransferase involved in cell wall biosynthesis